MNDKDFRDCMDKLTEVIDRLDDTVNKMSNTVSKMLDYCTVITLIMFITIVLAIVF